MKNRGANVQVLTLATFFAVLCPMIAGADGGIVRLHAVQGPFLVTLFVPLEIARDAPADISVLVQQRTNGETILDAEVGFTLIPPAGSRRQEDLFCGMPSAAAAPGITELPLQTLKIKATREQASNKLLYAALTKFDASGNWRLRADVTRGFDNAVFECTIPVSSASSSLQGLLPYLLLPPIAVTVFAMNQYLRRRNLQQGPERQTRAFEEML